jgi:adenosylmethionine-8-amino-7-oxononanoate aminotransferase
MVGFDLWRDFKAGARYAADERRGHRAVLVAREEGVAIRPLGDTMVLMPALAMPPDLLERLVRVTAHAVERATND